MHGSFLSGASDSKKAFKLTSVSSSHCHEKNAQRAQAKSRALDYALQCSAVDANIMKYNEI
jgi:hypothetical protein